MNRLISTSLILFLTSTIAFSQKVESTEKNIPKPTKSETTKPEATPKPVKKEKLPDPKKLLKDEVKFYSQNRKEVYVNAAKEGTASREYKKAMGDNANVTPVGNSPKIENIKSKETTKEKAVKESSKEKLEISEKPKVPAKLKEKNLKTSKEETTKEPKESGKPKSKKEDETPANSKTIKLDNLKKSQPKQ